MALYFNSLCLFLCFFSSGLHAYRVNTEKYSYFLLDKQGRLVHSDGLPVTCEGSYSIIQSINPSQTAIVVMDPWVDMACEYLNDYYREVTKSKLLPLIQYTIDAGHQIIILTNDPGKVAYNSRIDPELQELAKHKSAHILYHQSFNSSSFGVWLRRRRIDTLIYTGFASNQCVIGRQMGMIMMRQHGFRLFFVPEASAAVEAEGTWEDGTIHSATTITISQWIANLIHWQDLIESMK